MHWNILSNYLKSFQFYTLVKFICTIGLFETKSRISVLSNANRLNFINFCYLFEQTLLYYIIIFNYYKIKKNNLTVNCN